MSQDGGQPAGHGGFPEAAGPETTSLETTASRLVERIRREREARRIERIAQTTGRDIEEVRAEEELKAREAQAAEIAKRIVDAAMDRMAAELARGFADRLADELEKALDRATNRVGRPRRDGPGAAQDPAHLPATEESRIPLSDIQRVVDHLLSEDRETA